VSQSSLPGTAANYFRTIQRQFDRLQVLLPGESNDPTQPSGKSGTPNPISQGAQQSSGVPVTIHACDSTWHILPVDGDMIHLAASSTFTVTGNDAPLAGGTVSIIALFDPQDVTTQVTLTATDTTNPGITAGTDTTPVIQP
jgi:hypothetical protein